MNSLPNDPEELRLKKRATALLYILQQKEEYIKAVSDWHRSIEFRSNPIPFSKTAIYRELVKNFIYSLFEEGCEKQCNTCGIFKGFDEYNINVSADKAFYFKICKSCQSKKALENYHKSKKGV